MDLSGKNNCAGHWSFRPQMQPARTLVVLNAGALVAYLLSGLIVVLPAQSGFGSGSVQAGFA